jgi:hypothetical protein
VPDFSWQHRVRLCWGECLEWTIDLETEMGKPATVIQLEQLWNVAFKLEALASHEGLSSVDEIVVNKN